MPRWKFAWFLLVVGLCLWVFIAGDMIVVYQGIGAAGFTTNQWLDSLTMIGVIFGVTGLYIAYTLISPVEAGDSSLDDVKRR